MAAISLIIVNYNTAAESEALVAMVGREVDEVIVVDNASPMPGIDAVAARHPEITLIASPANLGYGAGANLGAAAATGEVLIVSNPDISTTGADLRRLASAIAGDIVVAAPAFRDGAGAFLPSAHDREPGVLATLWEFCWPFGGIMTRIRRGRVGTLLSEAEHATERDVLHALGACLAIDADAFRAVGGFDESFFLYREETDLCHRLRDRGGRVRHVPSVQVTHVGDASTGDALPVAFRPVAMRSHYRYIDKHQGRAAGVLARLLGLLGSGLWALSGPKRPWAWTTFRWHLTSAWRRSPAR